MFLEGSVTRVVASESMRTGTAFGMGAASPRSRLSTVTDARFQDVDKGVHSTAYAFAVDSTMPSSR